MVEFAGADTVKRGASPITLTSSLSNSKLKESNSSYSIKASNNLSNDSKESYTLDRGSGRSSSSAVKNVLFAPGVEKSSSAYMLSEQLSSNFNHHTNNSITPTTSTSQLIKQTLSPLVHHRPIQSTTASNSISNSNSNSHSRSGDSMSPLKMKPNSISSTSFGSYHQISNAVSMYNNGGSNGSNGSTSTNGSKNNFSLSSSMDNALPHVTPSQRTSSPSRSLSSNTNSNTNTNTLPSQHVGRYQFESNYSLKNAKSKNYASPGDATFYNALNSVSSSPSSSSNASAMAMINQTSTTGVTLSSSSSPSTNISNASHIYGTLPKSTVVSAVASEFEQLIARNASGNNHSSSIGGGSGGSGGIGVGGVGMSASNNHGNYNTLGSYRVQYSSTNPFLNHFGESSTNDDK